MNYQGNQTTADESTQGVAIRQSEVEREFTRVDEITAYIDKMVDELEEKLGRSILAQRKEATGNSESSPEPVRVPLAQSLYDHGATLERIRERLISMLSRIEA